MFSWFVLYICILFFFKQKTAYEMRISDWSSDVCSSDLTLGILVEELPGRHVRSLPKCLRVDELKRKISEDYDFRFFRPIKKPMNHASRLEDIRTRPVDILSIMSPPLPERETAAPPLLKLCLWRRETTFGAARNCVTKKRSEEHTSDIQTLM